MNRMCLFLVLSSCIIITISVLILSRLPMNSHKKYLLVPISEYPYHRIGPKQWQDWRRQVEKTIRIGRELKSKGNDVTIILLSHYKLEGEESELQIYGKEFTKLAPELEVKSYWETYNTYEQVEKSFQLKRELNGDELVFVSSWMHYLRILYFTHGREAVHYGVFGIPHPIFAFIHPVSFVIDPIIDVLGLRAPFEILADHEREEGRIL